MPALLGPLIDEPFVTAGLAVALVAYLWGRSRLLARASRSSARGWRAACFVLGLLAIAGALLSPLGVLDDEFLAAHMAQHLLLLMAAPPLLWLGAPLLPFLWVLPQPARRTVGWALRPAGGLHRALSALTDARVAVLAYLVAVGVWHLPALYDLAQGASVVHELEHGCFLAAGLLFWWPIVHPGGGRRRLGPGPAIAYLFAASLEGFAIGAWLVLTPTVVYAAYAGQAAPGRLTPLADQHLAGLIMWVPAGLIWMAAVAVAILRWLHADRGTEERMALYLEGLSRR